MIHVTIHMKRYSICINTMFCQVLCPSLTVPNVLPNVDECKKFEIRAHSSLLKGQMHKIFFFSVGHG